VLRRPVELTGGARTSSEVFTVFAPVIAGLIFLFSNCLDGCISVDHTANVKVLARLSLSIISVGEIGFAPTLFAAKPRPF